MSINKVMLLGNVGKQPEIKVFDNGNKVARISLATSESWVERNGDRKEVTEWHTINVFGKTVDIVEKYVDKGSTLFIEGKLKTRSWEGPDGHTRYSTEIICQSLQMIGKKKETEPVPYIEDLP